MGQALVKPRAVSNTRSAMSVVFLNRWIALFCHLFTIILVIYGPIVNLARSQNQFENPLQDKNVLVVNAHESMAPIFEKPTAHFLRRNPGTEHRKQVAEILQLRYARRTMETFGLPKNTAKELEKL